MSFNFILEKGMEEIMGNKMEAGGFIGRKCISMYVYIYRDQEGFRVIISQV